LSASSSQKIAHAPILLEEYYNKKRFCLKYKFYKHKLLFLRSPAKIRLRTWINLSFPLFFWSTNNKISLYEV